MQDYLLLELSIKSIANSDDRFISKLSNLSAVIYQYMDRLNWAGFYILDETWNNLYLGPFQGKMACSNIKISEGVCGKKPLEIMPFSVYLMYTVLKDILRATLTVRVR